MPSVYANGHHRGWDADRPHRPRVTSLRDLLCSCRRFRISTPPRTLVEAPLWSLTPVVPVWASRTVTAGTRVVNTRSNRVPESAWDGADDR